MPSAQIVEFRACVCSNRSLITEPCYPCTACVLFAWLAVPLIFLEDKVRMCLVYIKDRAGSFAQSSTSLEKTMNSCEKVGECGMRNLDLDELIIQQLHRSKMEPCKGATALGSVVLFQTGSQLQGSCLWLRGWAAFLTSPRLPQWFASLPTL